MIFESVCVGYMAANCYILAGEKNSKAVIIDPGSDFKKIKQILDKHNLKTGLVINTHGHYDHIGCDDKFGVPVYIHKDDESLLRDSKLNLSGVFFMPYKVESAINTVADGDSIGLDDITFKVIHIPGHTRGGAALLMTKPQNNILFSGDTLFYHGIGRSDLPGGSEVLLIKSIKEKLLVLPDETIVYPGHGEPTTVKDEKANNPFLS